MLLVTTFSKPKMFCNKPRTVLSCLYFHLTQCFKLLSKHLEANLQHLLGMELVPDIVFLDLSSENNDLNIYVFATGVSYNIYPTTCTINVSVKETSMLRVKIWMLSFLQMSNLKRQLL